jgi:hypothetical protein
MSLARKDKRRDKYGKFLIIGLVINYIDSDSMLAKLLQLNKSTH